MDPRESESKSIQVAIIGAGPGGLAAAANAASQNISHVLFEKSEIANTIYDYQLGKHVMAEPSVLPLRSQMSFEAGSREHILEKWSQEVEDLGIHLLKATVEGIEGEYGSFEISTSNGVYHAQNIVLAIGVQGTPRCLGVPGDERASYTLSDPGAFNDQDIVVVGAGDAAIENALALKQENRVMLINRSSEFPRAKDANARDILSSINSDEIKCYYNSSISRVDSDSVQLNTESGEVILPCDELIARIGAIPPRSFLEKMGIVFPSKDPSALPEVDEHYETNVKGIYAIGALIGYPLIKQAMNQGYEVIEHVIGNPVEPADQGIIQSKVKDLGMEVQDALDYLRNNISLFSNLTVPQFRELISESSLKKFTQDEYIFEVNDYTDTFFSIIEGEVVVEISPEKTVKLSQGDFFGEMSLFSGRRRSASIRASSDCLLLETQRRQILKLVRSSESVKSNLDKLFLLRALETNVFPKAKRETLVSLLPQLEEIQVKKGEVIFSEGDEGDYLYIIRKGSVQISRRNSEGEQVPQAYIPAGNYFGEMALVSEEPVGRSATVSAAVPCDLLRLSREAVQNLLQSNPEVRKNMVRLADARRVENIFDAQNEGIGDLLGFVFREGITDADNALIINSNLCVGCDNCESACAATHSGTSRLDRKGGKSLASIQVPVSCRHCENPLCMLDCPPNALERKSDGEIVINDSCIGCENCAKNCPYDVIQMVYDKPSPLQSILSMLGLADKEVESKTARAAKCDMCESIPAGPACVRACPTGAAMRINPRSLFELISK